MRVSGLTLRLLRGGLLGCCLLPTLLGAQELSVDGLRWYEIEVLIFAQDSSSGDHVEKHLPRNMSLGYPTDLRSLESRLESLAFPFAEPGWQAQLTEGSFLRPLLEWQGPHDAVKPSERLYGPPLRTESSHLALPNPLMTPFLSLGNEVSQFETYRQRLSTSDSRRILFHAVWRQPIMNRARASAVLITGGERFGDHHELEGSLRLSYNVNRIRVETRLWRNQFTSELDEVEQAWLLPALPANADLSPADSSLAGLQRYFPASVGFLAQERDMVSNELHYLDHPQLGVLIEARPYLLPDSLAEEEESE